MGSPEQPRLWPRLLVARHKLVVRPYKHPRNSLNKKRLSWRLHTVFTPTDQCSWYWKVLCMLLGGKGVVKYTAAAGGHWQAHAKEFPREINMQQA